MAVSVGGSKLFLVEKKSRLREPTIRPEAVACLRSVRNAADLWPAVVYGIGKALEKIKLGNSFLLFGALFILASIIRNNEIGLKLGTIIFISGGLFRLANIVVKKKIIQSSIIRFIIWIALLALPVYLIIEYTSLF